MALRVHRRVGLAYFGKRFLSAYLGRWTSADPLAVHVPGEVDLNAYAYVHGQFLRAIDPGTPTDVQVLFGIRRTIKSSNLSWNRQTFANRIPRELVPIACDSGGNLFCLRVLGPAYGKIVYVDLEQPPYETYDVAEGFLAFLNKLME